MRRESTEIKNLRNEPEGRDQVLCEIVIFGGCFCLSERLYSGDPLQKFCFIY